MFEEKEIKKPVVKKAAKVKSGKITIDLPKSKQVKSLITKCLPTKKNM